MKSMKYRLLATALAVCLARLSNAQVPSELKGINDSPVVSRYAGSVLQNAARESFAEFRIPTGPGRYDGQSRLQFDKAIPVDGKVDAYFYVGPKERTALEVFRNYQAALKQGGFTPLYQCEMSGCDDALITGRLSHEVLRPRRWLVARDPADSIDRDVRYVSAKVTRNGTDTYVLVFVAEPDSVWKAPMTALLVVEPKAMEAGKVTVSTELLKNGLLAEGRIALYGIYFDTGRAEVKPESRAQLDEMAKLLTNDRTLKVSIVGHTDNVGAVEANLALSQRRADAVVAALVSTYRIDAGRLKARGVASFAPVASNRTDVGRGKNRRVELVEQ